ncbi:hypothetical protein B0F90DRAFT_372578 [Multifurca ochricompacta]|uniref:Protein PBN1 n=1 Tax=Multifurca ochricompacta TaxID=376703 RepID=A0AAD4QNK8_9AGAM|nr:hypothetical protein B0F90DRAFT_372578 [Multifurca ochricompacta]
MKSYCHHLKRSGRARKIQRAAVAVKVKVCFSINILSFSMPFISPAARFSSNPLNVITDTRYVYVRTTVEQIPDTLHKVVELTPALNEKRSTLILISHVEPLKAQKLHVPVGDARDVALVENSTMVVILLAFLYLLRAILRGSQRVDDTISSRISISTEKKDS